MPLNAINVPIAEIDPSASVTAAVTTKPVRTDERGIGSERFGAGKRVILATTRGAKGVAGTMADTLGTIQVYGADLPSAFAVPGNPVLGNAFASATTPTLQMFSGTGVATTFQTNIPYAAFSNYNWIVETLSRKLVGTFTVTAGVIAGSSTTLNTAGVNVIAGDVLVIGGQTVTVVSVTSDTVATVTPAVTVTAGAVGYQLSQRDRVKAYNVSPTLSTHYGVTNVGGFGLITFGVAPPDAGTSYGGQNTNIAVYLVTPVQVMADGSHRSDRVGIRGRTCLWTIYTGDGGDDFDYARVWLEVSTAS